MSSDEKEFDDDNSSDSMPLAGLKKKPKIKEESEEEGEWDESPSKKRKSASKKVSYVEDTDDDDGDEEEDDDLPLAALKGSPPKKAKNGEKKTPVKKKKVKKEPVVTTSSTTSSDGKYQSASAALYGSDCQKGQLIQKLLCRWWYAIIWPDPVSLPEKNPANFDALDGFPGVYVCTAGDDVGKIMDVRDSAKCPSFNNFAKKSSEELKTLLLTALEEQKKQLIAAEGTGTPTEKELNDMIKWTKKVNSNKAEKEATKVLKAAKMTLS
jgi:hypothetical protein